MAENLISKGQINTTDKYRKGWERTFGKNKKKEKNNERSVSTSE